MNAVLEAVPQGIRSRNFSTATTAALSYEAESLTPVNGAAATALAGASGGTVVNHGSLSAGAWISVLHTNLTAGAAPMTHQGSYRVWARCYSSAAVPQFQLAWGVGGLSAPVANDPARLPNAGAFYLLDLGSIRIDPPPVGPSNWYGVVRAQVDTSNDQAAVDRLYFQPLDESAGMLSYNSAPPGTAVSVTHFAGTATDDASVGTESWVNPTRVTADDGSCTESGGATGTTHFLKSTGYTFSVPSGATILGIQVNVGRFAAGGSFAVNTVKDSAVRLVKAGTIQSTDRSQALWWPANETDQAYGGPFDQWGGSWTASDVNSSTFGAALSVTTGNSTVKPKVDYITIVVFYTLSGLTVGPDAVIYSSRTAELRTEGMFRSDSGGTIFAPVSQVVGDLPRVPPSGLENRACQIFLKPTRGDLDQLADSGLDGLTVTPKIRPSYLFRP